MLSENKHFFASIHNTAIYSDIVLKDINLMTTEYRTGNKMIHQKCVWSISMIKTLTKRPFFSNFQQKKKLAKSLSGILAILLAAPVPTSLAASATPINLPLINISQLQYIGGFRVPYGTFGASGTQYAEGPIAVVPGGTSMFIVGKTKDQAIAEISIPQLVNDNLDITNLNIATVLQPFRMVLPAPSTGNPQRLDRIGGMALVNGKLLVNAFEYYDADTNVTHTTMVINNPLKLASSSIDGYYAVSGRAHVAGWISPVPTNLQSSLGGTHLMGHSTGTPIISRHSVGPSAFAISPASQMIGASPGSSISTTKLMDFSLSTPAGDTQKQGAAYLDNTIKTNNLWTRISDAAYGFIVPGTRTYLTIGHTGGITNGIGYKITQDTGYKCPGPCSFVRADNYNYYWLWDVNDLLAVKNGQMNAYDVMPYAYGKFNAPFQGKGLKKIIGGSFDDQKSILYLTLEDADYLQNQYNPTPVIIAYKIPLALRFNPPSILNVQVK